jgi:asparagine synthase (glutamine-hydrolysing)
MLDAMAHRGPSGRGAFEYEGGAAGAVRLALVDLTDNGQQPIWSADRRVAIAFNGEIYNYREERARLVKDGYPFVSGTDTEVVLALYLERGVELFDRLRGMYAFAIFDWRGKKEHGEPKMLLARDPFGMKPLYVAEEASGQGALVVSSELKALLSTNLVERRIDREGLADYLAHGFSLHPRTILERVRMLDPGTYEIHAAGEPFVRRRFWRMPRHEPIRESLSDAAHRLRSTLEQSVALHAFADAPVGVFLSGGIDSTAIATLMRPHTPRLKAYTLRLAGLPGGDESGEASATAERLGCDLTFVDVSGEEIAQLLPRFARDLDAPSNDGLNTWLISRAAARDVRGVLSGVGGDELFAGYATSRRMAWLESTAAGRAARIAGKVAHSVAGRSAANAPLRAFNLAARRGAMSMWTHSHRVFPEAFAHRMAGLDLPPPPEEDRLGARLSGSFPDWRDSSPIALGSLLDMRLYMGCQLLRDSDAASMAHSLELRTPFADVEIAELARTLMDEHKIDDLHSLHGKRVLFEALSDVLPPGFRDRQKRGFCLPLEHWMETTLKPIVDSTCAPATIRRRGLLDPSVADRALSRNARLYPDRWTLMILELWMREVFDAPIVKIDESKASAARAIQAKSARPSEAVR